MSPPVQTLLFTEVMSHQKMSRLKLSDLRYVENMAQRPLHMKNLQHSKSQNSLQCISRTIYRNYVTCRPSNERNNHNVPKYCTMSVPILIITHFHRTGYWRDCYYIIKSDVLWHVAQLLAEDTQRSDVSGIKMYKKYRYFFSVKPIQFIVNTLRTGDADLRFYVTAVQDGWRRFAFLRYSCAGRVTQICVFTLQLCRTGDADLRF